MANLDNIAITFASQDDVQLISALRTSVAEHLTRDHGRGHWSSCATEKGVRRVIKTSSLIVAKLGQEPIGTLWLATTIEWLADGKRRNWKYENC